MSFCSQRIHDKGTGWFWVLTQTPRCQMVLLEPACPQCHRGLCPSTSLAGRAVPRGGCLSSLPPHPRKVTKRFLPRPPHGNLLSFMLFEQLLPGFPGYSSS